MIDALIVLLALTALAVCFACYSVGQRRGRAQGFVDGALVGCEAVAREYEALRVAIAEYRSGAFKETA